MGFRLPKTFDSCFMLNPRSYYLYTYLECRQMSFTVSVILKVQKKLSFHERERDRELVIMMNCSHSKAIISRMCFSLQLIYVKSLHLALSDIFYNAHVGQNTSLKFELFIL